MNETMDLNNHSDFAVDTLTSNVEDKHQQFNELFLKSMSVLIHDVYLPIQEINKANRALRHAAHKEQALFDLVEKNCALMKESIEDIADGLKFGFDHVYLNYTQFNIVKLIGDTKAKQASLSLSKTSNIELLSDEDDVLCYGDVAKLEQAVLSILEIFAAQSKNAPAFIRLCKQDSVIKFVISSIQREGSVEHLSLLNPFVGVAQNRPPFENKLLFTLIVIQNIIKAHGGDLSLQRDGGKLTDIMFTIPEDSR